MRRRAFLRLLPLALVAGCASVTCRPVTVVVERREQRSRLESEFRGLRSDGAGRVTESRQDRIVPEWWVRDTMGRWHRVDEATYGAAEPGREISVCL